MNLKVLPNRSRLRTEIIQKVHEDNNTESLIPSTQVFCRKIRRYKILAVIETEGPVKRFQHPHSPVVTSNKLIT